MIILAPLLLAALYGIVSWHFSTWRLTRTLNQNATVLTDPVLRVLTDQMANALDIPQIKVHIYEIAPVNGLAAPDGRIFITRGFMDKYRAGLVKSEEMASVIAHELGHVALGHSQRRMIDFSGQNAMRSIITIVIGRFIPFVGPWIANAFVTMLAARLSRTDEFEADAYASALLVKSGIGTEPQKSLFRKLEKRTGAHGAKTPAWLLSHPKTAQRIQAIEANEAKWNS